MNTTDTIQDNEKRAALEQVLTSATFVRATQVRNFLRYICEMELRGLGHTLHEYLIGVEALGGRLSVASPIGAGTRIEAELSVGVYAP